MLLNSSWCTSNTAWT